MNSPFDFTNLTIGTNLTHIHRQRFRNLRIDSLASGIIKCRSTGETDPPFEFEFDRNTGVHSRGRHFGFVINREMTATDRGFYQQVCMDLQTALTAELTLATRMAILSFLSSILPG